MPVRSPAHRVDEAQLALHACGRVHLAESRKVDVVGVKFVVAEPVLPAVNVLEVKLIPLQMLPRQLRGTRLPHVSGCEPVWLRSQSGCEPDWLRAELAASRTGRIGRDLNITIKQIPTAA